MSQQIIHFRLPVGDTQNYQAHQTTLCGIADTGSGLKIDYLDHNLLVEPPPPPPYIFCI